MEDHMQAHIALVVVHIVLMVYAYNRIMQTRKTDWLMVVLVVGLVANAIAAFIHVFKAVDYLLK